MVTTSVGEQEMMWLLDHYKINYKREYQFHDTRKWRFDFALTDWWVAIEVEGGIFSNGRHVRGTGYTQDVLKYNAAVTLGWLVLRYTTAQINGNVIDDLYKVIQRRKDERGGLYKTAKLPDGLVSYRVGESD